MILTKMSKGPPQWVSGQESACNAGDTGNTGLITGLGRSLGWEDPLEEEMATHSSIHARKSHGQRSLAGHSPKGHRVGHT